MVDSALYVIDTSSFLYMELIYPQSNFQSLWKKCARLINLRRLRAPLAVLVELGRKDDAVAEWVKKLKSKLFYPTTPEMLRQQAKILKKFPKLVKVDADSEQADPYVIAMALELEATQTLVDRDIYVVTQEHITKTSERNKKIPGVCQHYGLQCIPILSVIHQEGWLF